MKGTGGGTSVSPLARPVVPSQRTWRDEIVYQVITDRFRNGDRTNDAGCDPSDKDRYHGGDWQGVIDQLDYIKDLGATALWITPPYLQITGYEGKWGKDGYHGYWPDDFYATEPHFGTLAKLKELVEKAHEKGLKVLLDVVVNHTGYGARLSEERPEWFHHDGGIKWTDHTSMEVGELCSLPDLAQEKPEVARYLIDHCRWWAEQTGVDGLRLDAIPHVPKPFWQQFSREMHAQFGEDFMLVGECYVGDPSRTAEYQNEGGLDAVFDFPMNFAIRDSIGGDPGNSFWKNLQFFSKHAFTHFNDAWRVLKGNNRGDMRRLSDTLARDGEYRRPDLLFTMIDNHDMGRFLTTAGDHGPEKLKLALALLLTMRGVPSIYYGTEVGLEGDVDHNRPDMQFDKDPALHDYTRKLVRLRRDTPALRRGDLTEILADRDVYAYSRNYRGQSVVVVLNNNEAPQTRDLPLGRRPWVDALTGRSVGPGPVALAPFQALVLLDAQADSTGGPAAVAGRAPARTRDGRRPVRWIPVGRSPGLPGAGSPTPRP